MGTFDLLGFFITNFKVETIYEAGWYAAMDISAALAAILLALSIMIRSVQELLAGSKADWLKAFKEFVLYAVISGVFFLFVSMLIEFFNAIYGTLNSSGTMKRLGETLNTVVEFWEKSEFTFSMRDLVNTFYGGFGFVVFVLSYMVLVFVVFALRIAHAILVSLAAFWGVIAVAIAPVNGLKSLSSLKTLTLVAFLWPLFDAFFMYLVASVFTEGLQSAFDTGADKVTASQLVFVLFVYSIINIFMVAACMSAPFVAQGIANGTGNVTGMLASFGAAGIAAGAVAAKYTTDKVNKGGAAAGGAFQQSWGKGGEALNEHFGGKSPVMGMSMGGSDAPQPKMSANSGARGEAAQAMKENPAFSGKGDSPAEKPTASKADSAAKQQDQKGDKSGSPQTSAGGGSANDVASQATTSGASDQGAPAEKPVAGGSAEQGATVAAQASTQAGGEQQAPSEKSGVGSSGDDDKGSKVAGEAKSGAGSSQSALTSKASGASAAGMTKGLQTDETQTEIGREQAEQASGGATEDEGLAAEQSRKDRQARRGAIINQNKKG